MSLRLFWLCIFLAVHCGKYTLHFRRLVLLQLSLPTQSHFGRQDLRVQPYGPPKVYPTQCFY